jgi:hypothetical protein
MKRQEKDVYIGVIKELVKEKNRWEFKAKNPLPEGWMYAEDHPRIGEVLAVFPNILNQSNEKESINL